MKKAPFSIFQQTVQYFPTFSINIILKNTDGKILFVKRKNNPVKGALWVPGGRILNGETVKDAVMRILKEETGLEAKLIHLSDHYLEEFFDTKDFQGDPNYTPETRFVHYLTTVAVMKIEEEGVIELDSQSSDYEWCDTIPTNHPYLNAYFELVKSHL